MINVHRKEDYTVLIESSGKKRWHSYQGTWDIHWHNHSGCLNFEILPKQLIKRNSPSQPYGVPKSLI